MNGEQTPLQRAEEALRAAGFRPMRGHGQWSRDRPDIGVLEVVEMFDAKIVAISLWPDIAVLPAVLAAMRGEAVPLAAVETAIRQWIAAANQQLRAGVTEFGGTVGRAYWNPDRAWAAILARLTADKEANPGA